MTSLDLSAPQSRISVPFHALSPAEIPPPARVAALAARESWAHPLVIDSIHVRARRGERLGVIVGHNRFDVYALARLALSQGLDPRPLLARVDVSRAFTCHQLHRRVLTPFSKSHQADDIQIESSWSALYVLGLLDTFYDEDVKLHEAQRLLSQVLARLKELAADGLPVLITVSAPREPGREHLLAAVAQGADLYWQLSAEEEARLPQMGAPGAFGRLPPGHYRPIGRPERRALTRVADAREEGEVKQMRMELVG